jgi:hypothetical protein
MISRGACVKQKALHPHSQCKLHLYKLCYVSEIKLLGGLVLTMMGLQRIRSFEI